MVEQAAFHRKSPTEQPTGFDCALSFFLVGPKTTHVVQKLCVCLFSQSQTDVAGDKTARVDQVQTMFFD